jgi:hypothetical protein
MHHKFVLVTMQTSHKLSLKLIRTTNFFFFSFFFVSASPIGRSIDLNLHEKSEILADQTLDYISQCLLEEDVDENADCYHEAALRDMEKLFYDIIGEKYPPTQDHQLLSKQLFGKSNFIISISKDQVCPTFGESSK